MWKNRHLFSTMRVRMAGLFILLFVLAVLVMMFVIYGMLGDFLVKQRLNSEITLVETFAAALAEDLKEKDAESLYGKALAEGTRIKGRVLVLDEKGIVVADSHSEQNGTRILYGEVLDVLYHAMPSSYGVHCLSSTASTLSFVVFPQDEWVVYYTAAIVSDIDIVGTVLVSLSIQDVVVSLTQTMMRVGGAAVVILMVLIVFSIFFAKWLTKPMMVMTDALNEISEGKFHTQVQVSGSVELETMASVINMMSERLERLDDMRSGFIANASHELKTPLSSIKVLTESLLYQDGVPEGVYKEFLGDINKEIDRLAMLLNDLLVLSRTDQDGTANIVKIFVSSDELVEGVFADVVSLAEEIGVKLSKETRHVTIYGDPSFLSLALKNLVANGIRYSQSGGIVTVSVQENHEGTFLMVQDTGIGIPEEDIPYIFDRFYRVEKDRSRNTGGTGLGLSIVDTVAQLHGGRVTVSSVLGEGSVFVLFLPKQEDSA